MGGGHGVYTNSGCTTPATNGATGTLYAEIVALNFGQDSGTLNTVRLSASDMAGNDGTETVASLIETDTIAPNAFTLYSPTTWINTQSPTVILSFNAGSLGTSGLNVSSVEYSYSTTGSAVPTNWAAVTGVYLNSGCTILATNGVTGTVYAEIIALNFGQDSGTLNTVRISVLDLAENNGTQISASIIQIDTIAPMSFTLYSPTTWINIQSPNVIISFNAGSAGTSGLNVSSVEFAYSTTGSATPTNWAAVTGVYTNSGCTIIATNGATGTLYAEIIALNFGQDSGTQNIVRLSALDMAGNNGIQTSASKIQIEYHRPDIFCTLLTHNVD